MPTLTMMMTRVNARSDRLSRPIESCLKRSDEYAKQTAFRDAKHPVFGSADTRRRWMTYRGMRKTQVFQSHKEAPKQDIFT
jgi:hypothetical protein